MTAQMTEWYPPEIKPVRVGWYQSWNSYEMMMLWDGSSWCRPGYRVPKWVQNCHWRGLAADPAVTK